MGTLPSYATIENRNGWIFGKTQKYCFEDLAIQAAKKIAKRKKIDLNDEAYLIKIHDSK